MLASCVLQMLATAEAKVKYVVVLQVTGTGRGLELDVALQCCTEFFYCSPDLQVAGLEDG